MNSIELVNFRANFPILFEKVNEKALVYFDNGATTQKPEIVIKTEKEYYQQFNANVHRAAHQLSAQATSAFESARNNVQHLLHARHAHEIIWTKGTTESINLVAQSWGMNNLTCDDEIVLSYAEHHANIVPWQMVAEKTGAKIKVLPLDKTGIIDVDKITRIITKNTKLVCCSHISNVIGKINPLEKIIACAKTVGAKTLIDGAQAIANIPVNVQKLDCDFYVFSAHKMYGPTGVGVLYGKAEVLNAMPVYQTGGEMIKSVSFTGTSFHELPFKFEAGTPNIAGVIAFSSAIDFIHQFALNQADEHKQNLNDYCYQQLSLIEEVQLLAEGKPDIPLFSFIIAGHHQKDIGSYLDAEGIAVRVGHHCAMPLMEFLSVPGCIRVSLASYNSLAEIDYFIASLKRYIGITSDTDNMICVDKLKTKENETQLLLDKFTQVKSWDAKHREIMLLGKTLPRMSKELRTDETLITGCESAAWLTVIPSSTGVFTFSADSDAKIIRGLMVIVLAAFNNKSAEQILAFDIDQYFQELGLIQHLSPSRGNGLLAIVKKIKQAVS
ncbi:SufS family cysteine desulfurase [Thalassotalea castellviae]|uniref:cysteine desulfurase n=1 Tax=Thalassotalea castellviae TaxID=3075612 RepID=A0ABU3A2X0_9GAMM|nr:SufS family cysteine desulfurase [Thalassotalea sp. W431]MDT0604521.1 SufS family cysteine desulfurase [Thalassotalea sp. W431]